MIKVRFSIAAALAALTLAAFASVAEGGGRIGKLGSCANEYEFFAQGTGSVTNFRAALLCLINEARASQKLPALKRSAQLERVGQAQSNTFARTGSASHGSSLSDIAARFIKVGYHPAAYDEAFDDLAEGATPYLFLSDMLGHASIPCSEIFDPRFRDVGIGATVAGAGIDTLALEFGLRAGQRQPSSNARPSETCPHKVPTPIVSGMPVVGAAAPTANVSTVSLGLHCTARLSCVLTSTLTLPDAHASADSGSITIPAGATKAITYTFTQSAVAAELAATEPNVSLSIDVTAPVPYSGTISGPLT
ncbi:MAG: CAP domain-containing protein [Solirubrobacteraceae bacterium]